MTIAPYGTAAFATRMATDRFASLKADLATATDQLSTGKNAQNAAGLGANAGTSLKLQAKLDTLADTDAAIADGTLRINLINTGLTQITKLTASLPSSVQSAKPGNYTGATSAVVSGRQGLDTLTDVLNLDLNGRYLFAGRATDAPPVASTDLILGGDANRAGLTTLIAERKAADLGTNGLGRLAVATSGTTTTVSEEAAGLPFGMKLSAVAATGTGVTASLAGSPATVSVAVGSQPTVGDTLTITLRLPDGTAQDVKLTAGSKDDPANGIYAIGTTPGGTAGSIQAALTSAIGKVGSTVLPSASALRSATDYFASDADHPPLRVSGTPAASATAQVAGTAANTVIWYGGDTDPTPRDSAPVRVADGQTVGIGAAANEKGFQSALAGFAVLAAETFPTTDPTAQARYTALADRVKALVSGTSGTPAITDIATDFALASATLKSAASQNAIQKNQLQDALGTVQNADPQQVASELIATQTRLQASYQVTSTVLKLSLVNYL